jgi:hypothetical protein
LISRHRVGPGVPGAGTGIGHVFWRW